MKRLVKRNMPKLSVIIPTYNRAHLIKGAILFQGDRVNISSFAKALAVPIAGTMEIHIESLVSEL